MEDSGKTGWPRVLMVDVAAISAEPAAAAGGSFCLASRTAVLLNNSRWESIFC